MHPTALICSFSYANSPISSPSLVLEYLRSICDNDNRIARVVLLLNGRCPLVLWSLNFKIVRFLNQLLEVDQLIKHHLSTSGCYSRGHGAADDLHHEGRREGHSQRADFHPCRGQPRQREIRSNQVVEAKRADDCAHYVQVHLQLNVFSCSFIT